MLVAKQFKKITKARSIYDDLTNARNHIVNVILPNVTDKLPIKSIPPTHDRKYTQSDLVDYVLPQSNQMQQTLKKEIANTNRRIKKLRYIKTDYTQSIMTFIANRMQNPILQSESIIKNSKHKTVWIYDALNEFEAYPARSTHYQLRLVDAHRSNLNSLYLTASLLNAELRFEYDAVLEDKWIDDLDFKAVCYETAIDELINHFVPIQTHKIYQSDIDAHIIQSVWSAYFTTE